MPYFQLPQDLEKRDVAERFTPNGAQKVTLIVAGLPVQTSHGCASRGVWSIQ
ncbi:hypothetical protein FS842_007791 [Serendipita sp. 407]|nr:hypothetical protein FS842_007791 [Serendipita sp. 407]